LANALAQPPAASLLGFTFWLLLTSSTRHPLANAAGRRVVVSLESLDEFFENLELFSKILWFMKDCSTSIDKCYMSYNLAGQLFVDVLEPNLVYFDSLGNKENTEFDINEIEFAESIYQNFISGISLPENEPPKSISQKGALNRVARAFNFVRQSRMNNDLGLKIANFCTAFEALFSTSSSELTYKLATRLAYFIGSDPENRKQIFKLMRNIVYTPSLANAAGGA
jgi:hypothetical protein